MPSRLSTRFLVPLLLCVLGFAQPGDLTRWSVPQYLGALGYSSEIRHEGCKASTACAVLLAPANPPADSFGNLVFSVDAAAFRRRTVRLRAWIRVEPGDPAARAQLWLRVDRPNQQMGFFDNMGDRPITSAEWKSYEITGEVAADARAISLGVMSFGKTHVWIDSPSLEAVAAAAAGSETASVRAEIEKLYIRLDAAYDQRDMDALASLALPDARIRMGSTNIALSAALLQLMAQMEKGTRFTSHTVVTNVRVAGGEAVVSTNNEATESSAGGKQILVSTNRDTWTKTEAGWKLKESALISTRTLTPPTDAGPAKAVIAGLQQRAVPLAAATPGDKVDDLAAIGKAIGEARIVALGEATHGTREFFGLKHRLLEYLVYEKGFTVFAVEANWPEALAVDHYIKTGEGDPKKALAAMYFWEWSTQEMLDLVEWMRDFNKATGAHPILTFTSFDMQSGHVAAHVVLDYLERFSPDDAGPASAAYTAALDLEARRNEIYDEKARGVAERAAEVIRGFDTKRAELIRASSVQAWRQARQAATIVYQACTMRIPGKGPAYRDQMMAGNVEWLASQEYPSAKIVLWADNAHVSFDGENASGRSMGAWLHERYGKQLYVMGFAFGRGQLRAVGMTNGAFTGTATQTAPPPPEGSGDAILSGAGMPLFFLDMTALPAGSPLAAWLAQPHLFHDVGANWVADDPEANLQPQSISRKYDGLIFVGETHAARPLDAHDHP